MPHLVGICGKTDETVEHLGECEGLKEVYTSLRKLDEKGEWRQPKLNLLGVSEIKRTAGTGLPLIWPTPLNLEV